MAGLLADLHMYDPAAMGWIGLSTDLSPARCGHGFVSIGGRLYVHGGSYPITFQGQGVHFDMDS